MRIRDLFAVADPLRPVLLVTWAVPAARVQPRVPAPLTLETVAGADGAPLALLTVAAVLNRGAHVGLLPRLQTTFAQANYRTYVRAPDPGAPPSIYFFGNFVSGRAAWAIPWLVSPNVYYAPARMAGRVPATRDAPPWEVRFAMHGPLGPTVLEAGGPCRPPDDPLFWPDAAAGARFLTHRLRGYVADRLGGLSYVPVEHLEMTPWTGTLQAGTCAPWQHWGLLTAAEVARPVSVLVQGTVAFVARAPRRARS